MKLTPVTDVARFVSIDGRTVVRITRSRQGLDAYYDPPLIEDVTEVWGTCLDESRDSFHEIGQLKDVLKTIATQDMVVAAAVASPRRFAEMVATAHDLGSVLYVGSRAMWVVADRVADAKQFCTIDATNQVLRFHTLLPIKLFEKKRELPGIYSVSYSLSEFLIQSKVLVEAYPKQTTGRL